MKAKYRIGKTSLVKLLALMLCASLVFTGCKNGDDGETIVPTDGITENSDVIETAEGTDETEVTETEVTEPEDATPEVTKPEETEPVATEPEETTSIENEDPTEATEPEKEPEEVLVTMYVIDAVNYRTGPGTNHERIGTLSKGTSVKVVQGSKTSNGWYKVKIDGEYSYVAGNYLSETKPSVGSGNSGSSESSGSSGSNSSSSSNSDSSGNSSESGNNSSNGGNAGNSSSGGNSGASSNTGSSNKESSSGNNSGSNNVVCRADPSTGISWDGVSPIIYTYADGSTGTEPKDGATYEIVPGLIGTYTVHRDGAGRPQGSICESCGRTVWVVGQTDKETCYHHSSASWCSECGVWLDAYTCHYHNEDGVYYCEHCGKVCGDGSNGTCVRWLIDGNHTCTSCGATVPGNVCHTCGEG